MMPQAKKPSLALAEKFGGFVELGSVLIPAERLVAFLEAAEHSAVSVPYVECLFFGSDWVRPSMEYSRKRDDFASEAEFIAFAKDASRLALKRAEEESAIARFEVDVVEP